MTTDIFKLFAKSIESIEIKKTSRGALTNAIVYSNTVECIVKRRSGMSKQTADSEDHSNSTTIHFRASDAMFVEVGNFVKIDNGWRSIIGIKDGKDFDRGTSIFILATVGDDIIPMVSDDPNWSEDLSV